MRERSPLLSDVPKEKVILVIGSSKEGKSSLCNILAGMNHNDNFFVNTERSTAVKKISWRGNESETLTLIDTPGLYGVDQNVEDENIQEQKVNKHKTFGTKLFDEDGWLGENVKN